MDEILDAMFKKSFCGSVLRMLYFFFGCKNAVFT